MHGCLDCGGPLAQTIVDHAYRYDHGTPIQLCEITRHACTCGYFEIAIPKMTALHATIEQALRLHVDRSALSFVFKDGPSGVIDGAWWTRFSPKRETGGPPPRDVP